MIIHEIYAENYFVNLLQKLLTTQMISLKIITQFLIGGSALLALFIEYKWQDKRKKSFKYARNILIVITIFILILGVYITWIDEIDKNEKISNLNNQLNEAYTTLEYIKSNSDTLKFQIKPFLDLARDIYPNLDNNQALNKLKIRLDELDKKILSGGRKLETLSNDLLYEQKTIRSFHASVRIKFSGNWTGSPYPGFLNSPNALIYLRWSDNMHRLPDINFCAFKINFKTLNNYTAIFENTLEVQPGTAPLGEQLDKLAYYNQIKFCIPFTDPGRLVKKSIIFEEFQIEFYINGKKSGELINNEKIIIDLSNLIEKAGKNKMINPGLELRGSFNDILNINYNQNRN